MIKGQSYYRKPCGVVSGKAVPVIPQHLVKSQRHGAVGSEAWKLGDDLACSGLAHLGEMKIDERGLERTVAEILADQPH